MAVLVDILVHRALTQRLPRPFVLLADTS